MKKSNAFLLQSPENRAAFRTAIAAVSAVLIAFALHLDKPYWAGMTAVILANIYTGNIIDKALMRISGTFIGAWFGYFIAGFIANSFLLYLLVNFLIIAIAVYHYNSSRYAYAYLLGAIGAFIVISEIAISPDEAFFVAIWRPVEIGLGVLVSAAAAFCIFPYTVTDNMNKQVAGIFEDIKKLMADLNQLIVNSDSQLLATLEQENLALKRKLRKATEMIVFMRREIGFSSYRIDQFRLILDSFFSLCRMLSFYLASTALLVPQNENVIKSIFQALQDDLERIKHTFFEGQKMAEHDLSHLKLLTLLDTQLSHDANSLAIAHFIRQISQLFVNLMTVLSGKVLVNKSNAISYHAQLKQDPEVIKHSIKAGLSAILALIFWLISNWPGGLNGIISSIIISIRRSLFEMKNISIYRLLGCTLGGGVALLSLALISMDLYDLIMIIFCFVWAFSYFSFKKTAYAYIGLQANIALVLSLAQAGGPTTSLAPPLERLGGVVIGIATSFIVANGLWRTDRWQILNQQMRRLKQNLTSNCITLLSPEVTKKLYELSNLFWLTRGMLETLDKEALSTPQREALTNMQGDYENCVVIQATLTHIQETIDQQAAYDYAKQHGVDLEAIVARIVQIYSENDADKTVLTQDLNHALQQVFRMPLQLDSPQKRENCSAYIHALIQLVAAKDV